MHLRALIVTSLIATGSSVGCSKTSEAPAVPTTPAAPEATADAGVAVPAIEAVVPPTEADPAEAAPTEAVPAEVPDEIDEDAFEKDPTATDKVLPTVLDSDALDDAGLTGQIQHQLAWTDRHGTSVLVLTREVPKGAGAELVATHLNREGDGSWTKIRDFRELVSGCNDWRLALTGQIGEWSLTDLDSDGLAEVTFAWSAGCRTDWSPVTHKVLLAEARNKHVLRGQTGSETFTSNPAFGKAPEAFLAHAAKVWALTATEKPPERTAYKEEAHWGNDFLGWERVGQLPLGTSQTVVAELYGAPETKDPIFHDVDASGQYFETWHYPQRGLVIRFMGEDPKLADGGIATLTVTAPSDFKTRQGIGVGAPEADLERLYGRFKNADVSRAGWLGIGIEWTWLTFETKDGKVASIRWGIGAAPPSTDE